MILGKRDYPAAWRIFQPVLSTFSSWIWSIASLGKNILTDWFQLSFAMSMILKLNTTERISINAWMSGIKLQFFVLQNFWQSYLHVFHTTVISFAVIGLGRVTRQSGRLWKSFLVAPNICSHLCLPHILFHNVSLVIYVTILRGNPALTALIQVLARQVIM